MNAETVQAPALAPPGPVTPGRRDHVDVARQAWAGLLRPGMRLMRRLTLTQRLGITAAGLLLPMLLLMGMVLSTILDDRRFAMGERAGLELHMNIATVVLDVQALRAASFADSQHYAGPVQPSEPLRQRLQRSTAALDERLAADAATPMAASWAPLKAGLQALARANAESVAAESTYGLVERLRQFALFNGEVSGLMLDPEARSYLLTDVAVTRSLPLLEAASLARDEGLRLLAAGEADTQDRLRVLESVALVTRGVVDVQHAFEAYERAGGRTPGSWTGTMDAGLDFAAWLRRAFGRDRLEGDPAQHRSGADELIRGLVAVHQDTVLRLRQELDARIEREERRLVGVALLFGLTMLGLGYLIVVSALTVRGSLHRLLQAADAVAGGDLAQPIDVRGRDEVAQIGTSLHRMTVRLSQLVAQIRSNAAHVSMAGGELAEGSTQLSARTQEQGDRLRQAAEAVTALSQDAARGADEAAELDALTQRLHRRSHESMSGMQEAEQAMQAVRTGSEQVASVISVIDDLAFQTGMLALNASIEAARAGPAGQRFAIVAGEVRQLAQRSAESADEIRALVGHAGDQVRQAASRLAGASEAAQEVGERIETVSQRLQLLAGASRGQSAELSRVNSMIGNLDEITKDNARLVERASTSSHAMLQRADTLRDAVAAVRLQQGSADEARALADRALAHWHDVGRERALQDFNERDGAFVDRDLYIVVMDRHGTYSAFGLRPDMLGRNVVDMDGVDGRSFLPPVLAAVDAGGGWVSYQICNPRSGELEIKDAWVVPLGSEELLLCGVFRPAEEAQQRLAASWSAA